MRKITTNRKGVRITAIALAVLMTLAAAPSARAADSPFADVPSTHWAYNEIMEAYADGAVNGVSANAYQPNGNVTMAQFIAILTRAFCSAWLEFEIEESVPGSAWYEPNYAAAQDYGLFRDVPNNAPDTEVTREVMAQIMYNLMTAVRYTDTINYTLLVPAISQLSSQELQATKNKIPDFSSVSESMKDAVATCYILGLIAGVDASGNFAPKGSMTRAQTAVIYVRLKKVMETGAGLAAQPEVPVGPSGAVLTNGKPVTEENVLALIDEYHNGKEPGEKAKAAGFTSYMDGAYYDAYNPKYYSSVLGINGIECGKFAYAFWDDIFGDLPMREFTGHPEDVRPGDLLHFDGHWAIATQKAFISWFGALCTRTVDGGSSGTIGWSTEGSDIYIGEDRLIGIYTRYPE